jgi:hypothetical protein
VKNLALLSLYSNWKLTQHAPSQLAGIHHWRNHQPRGAQDITIEIHLSIFRHFFRRHFVEERCARFLALHLKRMVSSLFFVFISVSVYVQFPKNGIHTRNCRKRLLLHKKIFYGSAFISMRIRIQHQLQFLDPDPPRIRKPHS